MSVKQISIFVENKPGAMNEMTRVLAEHQVNLRALSLAETEGFGIVRIITDDVLGATTVLKEAGYVSQLNSVIIVAIPDQAGGLNTVLDTLTEARINIQYMYAILGGRSNKAYMILRVDDTKKAEAALRAGGAEMIGQDEVAGL